MDTGPFYLAFQNANRLGANFYPEDMTREEFEHWVAGLPAKQTRKRRRAFLP